MRMGVELRGRYKILNDAHLRKRASETHDPRHIFYEALLASETYEQYLARVGGVTVQPATTSYAVTGRMEIKYCRDRRWIADA
jgi:hypothetical protein